MESYLLDWANLLLRWLHVITAIAWVGSSFYFVFLDNNLIKPTSPDLLEKGVDGAMWAVHGGGFYNPQKYMVAPKKIHTKLHWFYWESYSTWLSGFALFMVLYLWNASSFLVDPKLMDWSPVVAGSTAVGFLVAFWLIYDLVCRQFGFRKNGEALVGAIMLAVVVGASWLACQLFPGRAAFLLVGAMIATAMSANVFFWIIPGQRKVVAAMTNGPKLAPQELALHGKRGKQRSVHNTYFTLPVLFAMLSNHYSFLYTHELNWLVLALMMFAGAAIRQFFVMRHGFHHGRNTHPWPYALAGVAVILGVIVWLAPAPSAAPSAKLTAAAPSLMDVKSIIDQRCVSCHSEAVQMKNIRLDGAERITQQAGLIHQQAVMAKTMPLNNATQMTDAERAVIAAWYQAGGK